MIQISLARYSMLWHSMLWYNILWCSILWYMATHWFASLSIMHAALASHTVMERKWWYVTLLTLILMHGMVHIDLARYNMLWSSPWHYVVWHVALAGHTLMEHIGSARWSCETSYSLHRGNLLNQILPHEKCVNRDKFNT